MKLPINVKNEKKLTEGEEGGRGGGGGGGENFSIVIQRSF